MQTVIYPHFIYKITISVQAVNGGNTATKRAKIEGKDRVSRYLCLQKLPGKENSRKVGRQYIWYTYSTGMGCSERGFAMVFSLQAVFFVSGAFLKATEV